MDISYLIQTWILIVFSQFASFSDLEQGMEIKYFAPEAPTQPAVIYVKEADIETLTWRFECKIQDKTASNITVKGKGKHLYITEINGKKVNQKLNIGQTTKKGLLMQPSETLEVLKLTAKEKEKLAYPDDTSYPCEKQKYATKDGKFEVTLYYEELFGLLGMEFSEPNAGIKVKVIKQK